MTQTLNNELEMILAKRGITTDIIGPPDNMLVQMWSKSETKKLKAKRILEARGFKTWDDPNDPENYLKWFRCGIKGVRK